MARGQSAQEFDERKRAGIERLSRDQKLRDQSLAWCVATAGFDYTYHFTWLGRPIIQYPQDMVAMQEIIWRVKPRLIVETGIARGGSLILSASILELIGGDGHVLGVDIDIRHENRLAIEQHPMFKRISMIEGSSTDPAVISQVRDIAADRQPVLVVLDSNHTHEHVLSELVAYSPLVKKDSYLVVFDTGIEDAPDELWRDRPWGKGNNPRTALREFLRTNDRFAVDREIGGKLLITVAPDGYLRCLKD